jgi:hypothetical protein
MVDAKLCFISYLLKYLKLAVSVLWQGWRCRPDSLSDTGISKGKKLLTEELRCGVNAHKVDDLLGVQEMQAASHIQGHPPGHTRVWQRLPIR